MAFAKRPLAVVFSVTPGATTLPVSRFTDIRGVRHGAR